MKTSAALSEATPGTKHVLPSTGGSKRVTIPEAHTPGGKALLALRGILKDAQKRENRRYPK